MALIIPTSIAGAYNYIKKKQVNQAMAAKLAPTAILGTIAGAAATQYVEGQLLMLLFSLLVCIAGVDLAFSIGENLKKQREKEAESVDAASANSLSPDASSANTAPSEYSPCENGITCYSSCGYSRHSILHLLTRLILTKPNKLIHRRASDLS